MRERDTLTEIDMAKNVHVATQVLENYGAHDWDGTGECPQYWKPKFGDDYIIYNAPSIRAAAEYVQAQFGRDDEYYREHVTVSSTDTNSLPEWKTPIEIEWADRHNEFGICLLYTSPSPRDATLSRMPSSA